MGNFMLLKGADEIGDSGIFGLFGDQKLHVLVRDLCRGRPEVLSDHRKLFLTQELVF